MSDDMDSSFQNMSLVDEEEEGLVFHMQDDSDDVINLELALVGRFLTERVICSNVMKETMMNIWCSGKGMSIKELGAGVYVFQFYHKIDIQRVFMGGPWTFNGHLLIHGKISLGDILTQIPLFHVNFWVQIHNLPAGFMNEVIGKHLGNFIGAFLEYDPNNNSGVWRMYMRIKVQVDVRIPLKQEKKVKKAGGDWRTVCFKYERLSTFCFLCGLLGHSDKFCAKLFEMEEDDGARQ